MKYGAIADDFTGATDLAGNWRARGLRTSVVLGVPGPEVARQLAGEDAVIVALKTRSIPVRDAVHQSQKAARFLLELGCVQIYDKYCSTFDSTPAGNIGPVADALIDLTGAGHAVVVPSFPDNRRTVYQGHLFVGDELLHESPMKDHPLNPMSDANVRRLLQPQTRHQVGLIPLQVVRSGAEPVREALRQCEKAGQRLIVVDAVDNSDLMTIGQATAEAPLVTGGSGLALGLMKLPGVAPVVREVLGPRVVLSGSASVTTRAQVAFAKEHLPHQRLDLRRYLSSPHEEIARLLAWVSDGWTENRQRPVMIYSVGTAEDLAQARQVSESASQDVESAFATLARGLSVAGATQFMVAGGETSGAVLEALEVHRLRVGQALSPGVSWLSGVTGEGKEHNFVLKSGNFGTQTLFVEGWEQLQ